MNYWVATVQLSMAIILKIEQLMANFLWKGGMHLIAWNKICKLEIDGGLGRKRIRTIAQTSARKQI